MKQHDAQPHNLPDQEILTLLTHGISTLVKAHGVINGYAKPSRAMKNQMRQALAGVIGDLETIRMGLA